MTGSFMTAAERAAAVAIAAAIAVAVSSTPAPAIEAGDLIVRARGIAVEPRDDSSGIRPDLSAASIGVDGDVTGEVDFTYMFTQNIGAELILATTHNDLTGGGAIAALGEIGDVRLLPPVLTLQYHFLPQGRIRPYVGVGVNYTIFFDESASASLAGALGGPTSIELDNSVGIAGQIGVDIQLTDAVFVNLDLKYVDIDADVTITTGSTVRRADVEIDPIIFGFGVGIAF